MSDIFGKRATVGGDGPYVSYGQQKIEELGKIVGNDIRRNAEYNRQNNHFKTVREWQKEREKNV